MCIVLCCCCRAIADEYYPNDAFTSDAPPLFYTLLHCIYMLMSTLFIYGQSHSPFVSLHSAHFSTYVCISGRVIKTNTNGRVWANVCVRLLSRKNCRMGRNGNTPQREVYNSNNDCIVQVLISTLFHICCSFMS